MTDIPIWTGCVLGLIVLLGVLLLYLWKMRSHAVFVNWHPVTLPYIYNITFCRNVTKIYQNCILYSIEDGMCMVVNGTMTLYSSHYSYCRWSLLLWIDNSMWRYYCVTTHRGRHSDACHISYHTTATHHYTTTGTRTYHLYVSMYSGVSRSTALLERKLPLHTPNLRRCIPLRTHKFLCHTKQKICLG